MKVIGTHANLAGYNWAWMNAVSLSSNLHARDIPSLLMIPSVQCVTAINEQ